MHRLIRLEIILTIGIAVFFVSSGYLIDSAKAESLYGYAILASPILWIVSLPMIIGKFVLLKKRLSEMAEHKAPVHSPYYRSKVIVTAAQSVVSMFANSVSAFAMVMSLFVVFGVNSEPFRNALHMEHVATYALFPICDLVFLLSMNLKRN